MIMGKRLPRYNSTPYTREPLEDLHTPRAAQWAYGRLRRWLQANPDKDSKAMPRHVREIFEGATR
jgi:hypothetical protein